MARRLIGALTIVFSAAAILGVLLYGSDSARAATFTVNSAADTDDGDCDATPDCTLREAIDDANAAAGPDVIMFDTTVFSPFEPATIALASELPEIGPELAIDGTGAGVIVEPAAGVTVQWGFFVRDDDAVADTDFALTNVMVRGFKNIPGDDIVPGTPNAPDGDAVYVCGDDGTAVCGTDPVDGVTLSLVTAYGHTGDGLDVDGEGADNIGVDSGDLYALGGDGVNVCCGTDVSVTGSYVSAIDDAIFVMGGGAGGSTVDVTGNEGIFGGNYGVYVSLCDTTLGSCDGAGNAITVNGNGSIVGSASPGVRVQICSGQSCVGTTNTVKVSGNAYVTNADFDAAVDVEICAFDSLTDCEDAVNDVEINGNTEVTGHYRAIEVDICDFHDGGCVDSATAVNVDGNTKIMSGQDDGVDVEVCYLFAPSTGCGDAGGPHTVSVSNNSLITGADGDDSVNLDICRGDVSCDNTTVSMTIDGNGEIYNAYNAIEAALCDMCDGTTVALNIRDNGPISSGEDDVIDADVCITSCTSIVSPQALSSVMVEISGNATITGADSDQAINIDMCTGTGGCSGLDNGGSPLVIPVSVLIEDNDTIWGGDDVVELSQCTGSGPCDYANVSLTTTGHPGGLNAVEDDTFFVDQCTGIGSCSFGDVTFRVFENGPMSAGDDAEVFDVDQCAFGRACAEGEHRISIMDNGELDSINQIFEGKQCDSSDDAGGCPDSTNTFILANHPLLRAGDDEVVLLDQCTFFGPADTVGCNNSTNTVSITGNGPSFGADDSFDIDQCLSFGADETTDNGCDNSTNLIEAMNNGDAFNSDEGIFVFDQCETDASVAGARACHNSTNTIRVTGNADSVATDGDSVLEVDQCNGLGCDFSDNYVIFTNNGYGNSDDEMIEVDQCQMYDEEAAGCNGGINSIEVTGNGDMLSEAYEVVRVNQCTGDYGSCINSSISTLVDENGFLWGGNSSDQAFEVDQCTSTICDLSDVSLTVTDHPGIIGHDGIFNIDICSFERYDPGLVDYVPGSCAGTNIDVVLERNGELRALSGEGLEADICNSTVCGVYINGGPIPATIDLSLADHLGISPVNSDDIVRMNLCRGDDSGCIGLSGTRIPVNITIDNNGPISATYQGFDVALCSFGSSMCEYTDIDFNVTNHPSISALSDETFYLSACTGLVDLTPDGIGSCAETTIDFNIRDNGPLFSGPADEGVYLETCYDNASVDFCDNLDLTLNYEDNGWMASGGHGIQVVGGESAAVTSPYTILLNVNRNDAIIGLQGHGMNLRGFFEGGSIDDNLIVGRGHHTDDDSVGPVQFVPHDGINFGEVRFTEEPEPEAEVYDMDITNNMIAGSHGRGITLSDTGADNVISGNTIKRNGGAGVAIIGGVDGLTDNTVTLNNITENGGTGVLIADSSGNTIGPANVITGNGTGGTGIVVNGAGSDGNTITQNTMEKNVGLGIDLNDDGITANDGGDGDSGPNEELNFPENLVLNVANLEGDACVGCVVEVFLTETPRDSSGHGEGKTYLGSATANGSGDFTFPLGTPCAGSGYVTTTATDTAGNTSEFSLNVNVSALCTTATPTPTLSPTPSPTPVGPTPTGRGGRTQEPTGVPSTTATPTGTATPTATASTGPSGTATPRVNPTRAP